MSNPWSNQLVSLVIVTAPPGAYAGIFIYSPSPGPGNLIGSWAAQAGTDPYGNTYPQGLNVSVGVISGATITGGTITGVTITGSTISGTTFTGTNFILNSSGFFFYSGAPALGNLATSIAATAGTDSFGNVYPAGVGIEQSGLVLFNQGSAPVATSGASTFYSSVAGRPRYLSSAGSDNVIQRADVNVSQFTMTTQTLPTIMSATMTYQANEGSQSSEYEIEIDGIIGLPTGGSGGGPSWTMSLFVDGVSLGGSFTVGATSFPIGGGNTNFTVRERFAILLTGSPGTVIMAAEGSFNRAATNAGNSTLTNTTIGSNSGGTTKNFDTTVSHSVAIYGNWSSTLNTGHNATVYRTRITRRF